MIESVAAYGENFTKWDQLMIEHCANENVPWLWMKAICMQESSLGLNPKVAIGLLDPKNVTGSASDDLKSWGLLQLEPATARDFDMLTSPERLNDPEYNIQIGSKLLRRLFRALNGEEEFVVKAWNEGQGNAVLEKSGRIDGNAAEYWNKYLKHKGLLT